MGLSAAGGWGATPREVATRLRIADPGSAERLLDDLVVREALELEVSDDGDLVYRPRATL